jgi:hypothetical protein
MADAALQREDLHSPAGNLPPALLAIRTTQHYVLVLWGKPDEPIQ